MKNNEEIDELKKTIQSLIGQLENSIQIMNSIKRKHPYSFKNIDNDIYQANNSIYQANKKIR